MSLFFIRLAGAREGGISLFGLKVPPYPSDHGGRVFVLPPGQEADVMTGPFLTHIVGLYNQNIIG